MIQISFRVNDVECNVSVESERSLLYILREKLYLTGTKCGCDTSNCGACRVIMDGRAVNSCAIKAENLEGRSIQTIEGLSDGLTLHPIQQAFIDVGAVQCGYCTPGMVMSTKALLDKTLDPSEDEIRKALSANLCRCTGYVKIIEAVQLAAKRLKEGA